MIDKFLIWLKWQVFGWLNARKQGAEFKWEFYVQRITQEEADTLSNVIDCWLEGHDLSCGGHIGVRDD